MPPQLLDESGARYIGAGELDEREVELLCPAQQERVTGVRHGVDLEALLFERPGHHRPEFRVRMHEQDTPAGLTGARVIFSSSYDRHNGPPRSRVPKTADCPGWNPCPK